MEETAAVMRNERGLTVDDLACETDLPGDVRVNQLQVASGKRRYETHLATELVNKALEPHADTKDG